MASNTPEEPIAKRTRLEESDEESNTSVRYKTIKLDMNKYARWVGQLSPEGLVNVFEIGVKVKESAILTVDVSKNVLEDAFASHMRPVQNLNESIDALGKAIKSQISEGIKECKDKIDRISQSLSKPAVKGAMGELTVENILKDRFRHFTVKDVARSGQKGKGDYAVETASGHKIMIEVKNRVDSVPPKESQKFEEGLAKSPEVKVGIMFSLCSGISNHSLDGDFEVAFDQSKNQYRIYVPNAMTDSDGNRVIWSVLMAEQLAGINTELTDSQVQGLEQICDQFKKDVEHSKRCEDSLKSLEVAMNKLKEELVPFLETVKKTQKSLNGLLHQ